MDGTLVDSTHCVTTQWQQWGDRVGVPLADILAVSHGFRTVDTMRALAPDSDIEAEANRLEEEAMHMSDGIVPIQGARRLLESLRPDQWAVVTSAPRNLALARMRYAGLPEPQVLIGAEDVTLGKPDPEGYLKAAALLGVAPADCIVVEDAPAGIRAARAARMRVLALSTTFFPEDLLSAECVAHFDEVTFHLL